MSDPSPPSAAAEGHGLDVGRLALDVRRLADRLRSLPQSRIQVRLDPPPVLPKALKPPPEGPVNRAALGVALAQYLADAALGVEHRGAPERPRRRLVPTLTVFAVGDQVGVTGTDVVGALRGLDPAAEVWTPTGVRGAAAEVLADCLAAVGAVTRIV